MSHWKKRRRTKAGRIAVSPFFFLLLALFAAVDRQRLLFPILSAAALHEAGHLAVLRLVGGQIEQFTLTPFGGELRIRRSEWLSYGKEIASVLAGPGVNLVCALVLGRAAAELSWERGYLLSGIHMLLALFNLLPLRPTGRRQSAVSDAFLATGPDYGGPDRTWGRLLFPVCGAAADCRVAGGSGAAAAACRTGILVRFVLVRRNRYCQITSLRVK